MTVSATQGITTVVHPVSHPAAAKAVHAEPLGVPPRADGPYDARSGAAGPHMERDPGGRPQGLASPPAAGHVPDLKARITEVTAAAGATVKEPVHGGGRLVAATAGPEGNLLGLLEDR